MSVISQSVSNFWGESEYTSHKVAVVVPFQIWFRLDQSNDSLDWSNLDRSNDRDKYHYYSMKKSI